MSRDVKTSELSTHLINIVILAIVEPFSPNK